MNNAILSDYEESTTFEKIAGNNCHIKFNDGEDLYVKVDYGNICTPEEYLEDIRQCFLREPRAGTTTSIVIAKLLIPISNVKYIRMI